MDKSVLAINLFMLLLAFHACVSRISVPCSKVWVPGKLLYFAGGSLKICSINYFLLCITDNKGLN